MTDRKETLGDFAVCGGEPAFAEELHVNRPYVGERTVFLEYLNAALDRAWLTNDGPLAHRHG